MPVQCSPVGNPFELCKKFSSEKIKQVLEQKEFMPELCTMNRRGKSNGGKHKMRDKAGLGKNQWRNIED